ncbi:MAG: NifU family protein [Acidimicrobiaceae bacterium]|nr:NifU family protein [Acidimicrobiaceae bacterium]
MTDTAAPTEAPAAEPAEAAAASGEEILIVTDAARTAVLAIRDREDDGDTLGLRVEVTGTAGIDYAYDLTLDPVADAAPDDHIHNSDGLTVVVPDASVSRLRGSTLDVPSIPGQGGLVIRNPNRPNPLGDMGRLDLTGSIAEKVQQLLDMSINPALASHGGYASLVDVNDDDSVVVTMGGGCQGCAMSQATLSDGIKRAIMEAIEEVTDVIDVTDHEAGENPYFS